MKNPKGLEVFFIQLKSNWTGDSGFSYAAAHLLKKTKTKTNAERQHVTAASSQSLLTFVSGSPSVAACSTVCLRSSMVSSSMFLSTWSFSTCPRSAVPPASSSWFGGGEGKRCEGVGRRGGAEDEQREEGERVRDNDKAATCRWPTTETCFTSTSHTPSCKKTTKYRKKFINVTMAVYLFNFDKY